MSDLAPQFYDAFTDVHDNFPQQLFCTWHVDKAWKEQLKEKNLSQEYAICVYKGLRALLVEPDRNSFNSKLSKFTQVLLSTKETEEFGQYFHTMYGNKTEKWAYCHRAGLGINTNMVCESFHRVLKYSYLKGKYNKRVDRCLLSLMKFNRNKGFDFIIKKSKKKRSNRLVIIRQRHLSSLSLSMDLVNESNDKAWVVTSHSNSENFYKVSLLGECENKPCNFICSECNICCHVYTCTCPDSLIYNTICKHVHLVHRKLSSNSQTVGVLPNTISSNEIEILKDVKSLVGNSSQNTASSLNEVDRLKSKTEGVLLELITTAVSYTHLTLPTKA